jgi:hypothetical protein
MFYLHHLLTLWLEKWLLPIILPAVTLTVILYGKLGLSHQGKNKLWVSENSLLRRMEGRTEGRRGTREDYTEELHILYVYKILG